jgi:hypothetical protein
LPRFFRSSPPLRLPFSFWLLDYYLLTGSFVFFVLLLSWKFYSFQSSQIKNRKAKWMERKLDRTAFYEPIRREFNSLAAERRRRIRNSLAIAIFHRAKSAREKRNPTISI